MNEVHEQIGTLEQRFQRFRISGSPDVIIEGDIYHGYAVNVPQCGGGGAAGPPTNTGACCLDDGSCSVTTQSICEGGGGTYQGDGTNCDTTGACCMDGDCIITTEDCCSNAGGDYQGDDTACDPNPCVTGACCVGTDCTIETEDDCTSMGGTYLGGGTTCDPNPCVGICCDGSGGFAAFDGSGRKFLTRVIIVSGSDSNLVGGNTDCNWTIEGTETSTIDPVTCDISVVRGGSISGSATGPCGTSNLSGSLDAGNCACGGGILENFTNSGFHYTYDSFLVGCVPHTSGGCGAFDICGGFGSGPSEPCSFWDFTTATTATYNSTGSGGGTLEVLGFLSDECTP